MSNHFGGGSLEGRFSRIEKYITHKSMNKGFWPMVWLCFLRTPKRLVTIHTYRCIRIHRYIGLSCFGGLQNDRQTKSCSSPFSFPTSLARRACGCCCRRGRRRRRPGASTAAWSATKRPAPCWTAPRRSPRASASRRGGAESGGRRWGNVVTGSCGSGLPENRRI